jgi:hypothetical protein
MDPVFQRPSQSAPGRPLPEDDLLLRINREGLAEYDRRREEALKAAEAASNPASPDE